MIVSPFLKKKKKIVKDNKIDNIFKKFFHQIVKIQTIYIRTKTHYNW